MQQSGNSMALKFDFCLKRGQIMPQIPGMMLTDRHAPTVNDSGPISASFDDDLLFITVGYCRRTLRKANCDKECTSGPGLDRILNTQPVVCEQLPRWCAIRCGISCEPQTYTTPLSGV